MNSVVTLWTTAPGLPPPSPGVAVHKVSTEFMLSGSVADYDVAAQTAIKTVLAAEAEVSTAAVSLTLTAGSVIVYADIYFGTETSATATACVLSQGVLANGASLETAINAQFAAAGLGQTTTVNAILAAPQVAPSPSLPPPAAPLPSSATGLLIPAIAGGVVAFVLAAVCTFYLLRRKRTLAVADHVAVVT